MEQAFCEYISLFTGTPLILSRVCVAGALRLYFSITNEKSNDATYDGFNLWTWESIEVNLGIVCASAPCLKALVARVLPRLMPSHSASNISHTPTVNYQRNAKRDVSSRHDYALESMGEARTEERIVRESGESQEGLTKVHEHTLVAKVSTSWLV